MRITSQGWQVVEEPPILFRHYSHQSPQVEPQEGNLDDIFEVLNVTNPQSRLLIKIYLVAALLADIPLPVLVLFGEQGTAKSFFSKLMKLLLDPSILLTLSHPDSYREFVQLAAHHRAVFLDNLTSLPQWLSDALCRLCTGDGFSKRELYSDDDDIIYTIRGLGGINGINNVATRPDLLDRALIILMEAISEACRLPEKVLLERFEKIRPGILGAMFTTLSRSMGLRDGITLERSPRLSDFAHWGAAISVAMGYEVSDFLDAYGVNVELQNQSALEESPVAQVLMSLIPQGSKWEGSPTELLVALTERAERVGINTKDKSWPKSANILTRRLKEVAPNLRRIGIEISDERTNTTRMIRVSRQGGENTVTTVTTVTDADGMGKTGVTINEAENEVSSRTVTVSSPHGGGDEAVATKGDDSDDEFPHSTGQGEIDTSSQLPWDSFLSDVEEEK